ncbi:MAG: FAD-dependent oxidoreductase, partial [Bdellovibrionales bacterium]|nr:FAD-dependent oxidoreductase [Bdellovibrionales bacterium]
MADSQDMSTSCLTRGLGKEIKIMAVRLHKSFDALVIGGGLYGIVVAIYLSKVRRMKRVLLVERESALMTRASCNNQARVHNGYHYPRSFATASRSHMNLPRFVAEWPEAIRKDFIKVYAIARHNSKVSGRQFENFCHKVGARIQRAEKSIRSLFNKEQIQEVYLAQEYVFDITKLAPWLLRELGEACVEVLLGSHVESIHQEAGGISKPNIRVKMFCAQRGEVWLSTPYVFNCSYSGLNQFKGDFDGGEGALKHEIAEVALVKAPPELRHLGVTVMDGPFFSIMPFPSREGVHSLSHVSYTPHLEWTDKPDSNPYEKLEEYSKFSQFEKMILDGGRYMPALLKSKYLESIFEVKTVRRVNEIDDGRPILFRKHSEILGCYSILGGKIDNIYDVYEKLDAEFLAPSLYSQLS